MNDLSGKSKGARRNAGGGQPKRPQRAELVWEGKHDEAGRRVAPLRVALPFQTVETVNEPAQDLGHDTTKTLKYRQLQPDRFADLAVFEPRALV